MEPSLRPQFTTYNGHRYRMCVYRVFSPEQSEALKHRHIPSSEAAMWGGFAESARFYLGGTGHHLTRARAMRAVAQRIADHERNLPEHGNRTHH